VCIIRVDWDKRNNVLKLKNGAIIARICTDVTTQSSGHTNSGVFGGTFITGVSGYNAYIANCSEGETHLGKYSSEKEAKKHIFRYYGISQPPKLQEKP
jgi:hypothetical protein